MNLKKWMQDLLGELGGDKIAGVLISEWVLFGTATIVLLLVFLLVRKILKVRLAKVAGETEYTWDDFFEKVVDSTYAITLLAVAMYIGTFLITMPLETRKILLQVIVVIVLIQVGFWANASVEQWLRKGLKKFHKTDIAVETTASVIKFFAIISIWAIVVALVLSNMGIKIGAVIAGLGVGGIAVAFALQKILGDVFSSVAILMDKPFEVGDFIIVGDLMGSVERIGIKTTRIRSLGGEQLIFANTDLIDSRIRNYKRMRERRVVFAFGLIYQTNADQLERAKQIVEDVIKNEEKTRHDRVHFKAYGASSLDFEVVYYVLSPDYNLYMDIQEKINLNIYRRFAEEGLSFAYPTQTLYVRGDSPIRVQSERIAEREVELTTEQQEEENSEA
ncbi:mechanosensitive ion channel family protein [bacterium]|nr:mechanosensitive ion channel family protein [bacterium]